jgi:hypothetical protein
MKKYVEWSNEKGKIIRLRFEGTIEEAEKSALNISRIWKSRITKIIIVDKGAEKTALEIIRN